MLLTFGDAKDSDELADVSGVCSSSSAFKSLLNQATRKLMRRGNWFGTVQKIQVCVYNNCITWPRFVGTILQANLCGQQNKSVNFWYSFLPIQNENWGDLVKNYQSGIISGNVNFENSGTGPVYRQLPCGQLFYVRFYPQSRSDIGKTITVFGIDNNGQVIRETRSDGTIQEGYQLTLAVPFVVTPTTLQKVERILKDTTADVVRGYYYDSINDAMIDFGVYQPSETSPQYMQSKIVGCRPMTSGYCTSISALVKLQFIPVVNDQDLVLIENLDALQLMMFAEKNRTAGKINEALELERESVRELNYSLRDRFPIEQFTVSFNPYGTARLDRVLGGFI